VTSLGPTLMLCMVGLSCTHEQDGSTESSGSSLSSTTGCDYSWTVSTANGDILIAEDVWEWLPPAPPDAMRPSCVARDLPLAEWACILQSKISGAPCATFSEVIRGACYEPWSSAFSAYRCGDGASARDVVVYTGTEMGDGVSTLYFRAGGGAFYAMSYVREGVVPCCEDRVAEVSWWGEQVSEVCEARSDYALEELCMTDTAAP
jgi:hypothetical protein